MIKPRNSDNIISEINELNQVIENTQKLSQQFPEDQLLKAALQQDQHRKRYLAKGTSPQPQSLPLPIWFGLRPTCIG